MKKILIATGGTGGHVFPAIALGEYLTKCGYHVYYTTDSRGAKYYKFPTDNTFIIDVTPAPAGIFAKIKYYLKLIGTITDAVEKIKSISPDVVIGFGGYASFPVVYAAKSAKVQKIIIHESNAIIGKANDFLLSKANYLATGFNEIKGISVWNRKKIRYTGTPVRETIIEKAEAAKFNTRENLNILIFGGSQAASILTKFIPGSIVNLPDELKKKIHVFHQCKVDEVESLTEFYQKNHISCHVKDFFEDMHLKYAQTDIIIARAGASSIAEIIATNIPAILIPLERSAKNHQYLNAKLMAENKAAFLLREADLIKGKIDDMLLQLVGKSEICINMKNKLKELNIDWKFEITKLIKD